MLLKKSKRGAIELATETLGKLIFAAVVLIIMVFIIYKWYLSQGACYNKEKCMASVFANSNARVPLTGSEIFSLNCPTRYVYVDSDKITIEVMDCETKEEIKFSCPSSDIGSPRFRDCFFPKLNEVIAEQIKDCWEQFGAGNLRVFSTYNAERQCLICSVIEFSPGLKERYAGEEICFKYDELNNYKDVCLDEYMRTHTPFGHEISYYEFSLDATDGLLAPYYDIDMDRSYAIVFTAMNENHLKSAAGDLWGFLQEQGPELLVGKISADKEDEIRFVNVLNFIPQEEVVNYCDTLETTV
ncbi:hypothetical protein JXB41_01490 [Candidatus Woesearchaeota archaeon]|nr:hypothetical protein [Candidatus Woesearchaeota archaeon]